ncbi:nucleotide sugar dehydrogenase [Halovivax asiaticus JCM 14624]|uniref:UDP-N-acetyl-D-mannosamine dehydrogenase n=1 Tax=Halovivax asiaticus JCM 14624 TaxID=1227490 RepID=M0BMY3_9EURY|nr:nucleotide sugar dehydrogenase [Halovivax asiaticus]ELZ10969.1 nucleotide sugar dehydrogenase [Halovivax asiaticus JCM 14624]
MSSYNENPERASRIERQQHSPKSVPICLVGLGYVGLPLAIEFDHAGQQVHGYDIDEARIRQLDRDVDVTGEVGDAAIAESNVQFTADPAAIAEVEYVFITVPTPVDAFQNPDFRYVERAGHTIGEWMTPGTTVVLESTVYPGATRDVLVPALESSSELTAGEGFHVAYSPERASPGDDDHGLRDVVKVVGADEPEVRDDVATLYESVVGAGVHRVGSIEAAEATKCIENVQRDINIALVNELSIVFHQMGLDTQEVLDAARTKWNFHDYSPGLVGGHCIPVDPFYFAYGSEMQGYTPKLTLKGREINEYMPKHVGEVTLKALNDVGKVLGESEVLVLGLAYKPNVTDIRTSQVRGVIDVLRKYDIDVAGHDPHAADDVIRDHFDIEVHEVPSFDGVDCVLLATAHDAFERLDLAAAADAAADDPVLMDVNGVFDADDVTDHGFTYRRL